MNKRNDRGTIEPVSPLAQKTVGRRTLMKGAVALAGGTGFALLENGCAAPDTASASSGAIIVTDPSTVVETTAGKVRGFARNGIYTFKGIPYGAATEGAARFMPPNKPAAWPGVRPAMYYGQVSPQGPRAGWANNENAFLFEWDDGIQGEDCLRVNVWTPGIKDGRKRPVMVWLHGGGFTAGSGQELKSYDGENLARRGDVVAVSVNHRLGVVGFLNLAEVGGSTYASSANAGMLDLVAALEWVRDNIANFGGDPGNVMIYGQSGGGAKVSTLMAMPAAKGLFHRAVVQSGSSLRQGTPENSIKLAAAVLAELGLRTSQLDQLHKLPFPRLVEAAIAAQRKLSPPNPAALGLGGPRGIGWGPVVDGKILPQHPFDPAAPAISANVPMMIGTVMNESSPSAFNAALESMPEEEMKKRVSARYGDKTDRIVEAYRKAHPGAKPIEILSLISSSRTNAVTQAERKAAQGAAPVYVYWFCWHTPVLDGRPRSFHCSELSFVFFNTDRCAPMTGGTAEARELAGRISDAWINFARKGDPNHSGLPNWPAFTAANGETMIFDKKCGVKNDPDREERKVLEASA